MSARPSPREIWGRTRPALPLGTPAAMSVFSQVVRHGPTSRVELAEQTGLSRAAITKAATPLIAGGFLRDTPKESFEAVPGRPATDLGLVADAAIAMGVKVTASGVIGVSMDLAAQVIDRTELNLPGHDVSDVVDAIESVAFALGERLPVSPERLIGVGVAISGDVDAGRGVVRDSAQLGWHQVALAEMLTDRLELPVVVDNDVHALTVAEHWFGMGTGVPSFAIVTIGAGIGCGLYLNGDVVTGAFGVAGELGHLPLVGANQICVCGRRGCVETVASSLAIVDAVQQELNLTDLDLSTVARLAHQGNQAALTAFDRAGTAIGTAIATMVSLVGPDKVVIVGEAVTDFDLYESRIREAFAEHVFGAAAQCELSLRPHSFEDWARGAASTLVRGFVTQTVPAW